MNGDNFFSMNELKILLISALLAIFGGFAKLFMSSKRLTIYQFLGCSIISGFTGVMASYLVRCMNLSPALQGFIIGMSGFAGPAALSAFTSLYEKKLGIKVPSARNGNDVRNKSGALDELGRPEGFDDRHQGKDSSETR